MFSLLSNQFDYLNDIINHMNNFFKPSEFMNFVSSFNDLFWFITYILIIFGAFFWFHHKKIHTKYHFEQNFESEIITKLIDKGIESLSLKSEMARYFIMTLFSSLIILLLVAIFLKLFGVAELKIVVVCTAVFLIIFTKSLKTRISITNDAINKSIDNFNYISYTIFIKSYIEKIQELLNNISKKKIIKIIIFYVLPLVLLYKYMFLIIYFILVTMFYLIYCISVTSKFNSLRHIPWCVSIIYDSGQIESNLILYQITNTDYRFIKTDYDNELIVPISSIKKITNDYSFELRQLNTDIKVDEIFDNNESDQLKLIIKFILKGYINDMKFESLYRKATIHIKREEYGRAIQNLEKAKEINKIKFNQYIKRDNNLNTIKNNIRFKELQD